MHSLSFEPRQRGCRGARYLEHGHELVFLENSLLRIGVLASKGADIIEFRYKPLDVNVLWRSDRRVEAPRAALHSNFLDQYYGGWQESLPSGAGTSRVGGVEHGVHGEAPLVPWTAEIVADDPAELAVRFRVRLLRSPFELTRVIRLREGSPQVLFEEVLRSLSPTDAPYVWGHHPAFGEPLLGPETVCDLPGGAPGTLDAVTAAALGLDQVSGTFGGAGFSWLDGLSDGWFAIRNPVLGLGFCLAWEASVFPCLWSWRVSAADVGYPFWGSAHLWALEPFSTPPGNVETLQAPSVLAGGASIETRLVASIVTGTEPVVACDINGTIARAR